MKKVVYTPVSQVPLAQLFSPLAIFRELWKHRQLVVAFARRDFSTTHRETYLGVAWNVLSPLIMLALFTFVFGGIFNGKFNTTLPESKLDFALALFVGLSLFNMVGLMMNSATSLMISNSIYVKSLQFPVEIIPVAFVLHALFNLLISLSLCMAIALYRHGSLPLTALALPALIVPLILLCLGLAWVLSASSVFIRDIPSITSPITMVLMFTSLVFFPLSSVSPRLAFIFKFNPLATLIEEARGALLYGVWPSIEALLPIYIGTFLFAVFGYGFFVKSKISFSDVL